MTAWSDAGVRAIGLSGRLVHRRDLTLLASLPPEALAATLSERGLVGATDHPGPADLDLGLRRRAAEWMRALKKWCGSRAHAVLALFEDEERRAIRRMLRGAMQGAPERTRLEGLVPTDALPERALELLAGAPRPRDVGSRLISLKSPYGPVLFPEVDRPEPDLYRLESLLDRTWAERSVAAARRADRHFRNHLRTRIDLTNAETALVLASQREDRSIAEQVFLEGGVHLDRATFTRALEGDARDVLARSFAGTPLDGVFAPDRSGAEREATALRALIRWERDQLRRDPVSTAALIWFALSLRAHVLDLARIVWASALAVPAGAMEGTWVTA